METLSKWLIGIVVFLVVVIMGISGSNTTEIVYKDNPQTVEKIVYRDNPQIQADLDTCRIDGLRVVNAWDTYIDALYDYCLLDQSNNICIVSQPMFEAR